jgi:hypothetical protein
MAANAKHHVRYKAPHEHHDAADDAGNDNAHYLFPPSCFGEKKKGNSPQVNLPARSF